MTKKLINYKMVDIVKYVAAILVICIHCNPIVPEPHLNYFIKQIVCRVAVPFFFISSAYFVRKGMRKRPGYLKQYLKNLGKSYLFWSIIFIPIGMDWINQNLKLANNLLPFALIFGLIHVGTYYHLWYIPAMLLSLWVVAKLLNYLSYKLLFLLSALLYLFGSLETYYVFLGAGWLKKFFDLIIQIFFTTRSGLFFGMIFVVIGFLIYDYQEKLKAMTKYIHILTIVCFGLLIVEGIMLYHVEKLDMNFLLLLLPFSFFFFLWTLSTPLIPNFDTRMLRELSKYYYFVHPVCIVIIEELGAALEWPILSSGLFSFALIFLLTHLLCLAIIHIQKQNISRKSILIAGLLGLVATFLISSIIYALKTTGSTLKFELVPSIWFFASFLSCYLLQRNNSSIKSEK